MRKISFISLLILAFTVSNVFGQVTGMKSNKGDLPKAKSMTLVSPNGGETWKIGSTHSIRWISQEVQFVRIDLSTTGGTSWKTIISSTTASVGQYDWTISANNYSSTQQAQIRVYDISDGTVIDQSNSNFTISQLDVMAPTSAIKMQAGDNYDIKWTSSSDINNVSIEYTTNGLIWNQITASVSANSSPYTWNVPDEPTATAQIRITDLNNSVNVANSDTFSIASLALTSPTGGEDWFSGTNQTVSWTSTNVSFLKIEYSTDNGLTWSTVANSESAGSGNYS